MFRMCGEPRGLMNGEEFAFAGGRALWLYEVGGNDRTVYVETASLAHRRLGTVEDFPNAPPDGPVYTMAGRGQILAYETSTGTRFLRRGDSWLIPGHPRPTGLAVPGGSLIALVRGTAPQPVLPTPPFWRPGPVQVVRAADGSLVKQIKLQETINDVALTSKRLALLVLHVGAKKANLSRIYVFNLATGKRWSAPVWYRTEHIAMDQHTVVYEAKGRLHAIDAVSGRGRVVARIQEEPLGLSIQGGLVVWGEVVHQRSLIRLLQLAAG